MIAIYIDDPGMVLFKQVRFGRDGGRFRILKLRSIKKERGIAKGAADELESGSWRELQDRE